MVAPGYAPSYDDFKAEYGCKSHVVHRRHLGVESLTTANREQPEVAAHRSAHAFSYCWSIGIAGGLEGGGGGVGGGPGDGDGDGGGGDGGGGGSKSQNQQWLWLFAVVESLWDTLPPICSSIGASMSDHPGCSSRLPEGSRVREEIKTSSKFEAGQSIGGSTDSG